MLRFPFPINIKIHMHYDREVIIQFRRTIYNTLTSWESKLSNTWPPTFACLATRSPRIQLLLNKKIIGNYNSCQQTFRYLYKTIRGFPWWKCVISKIRILITLFALSINETLGNCVKDCIKFEPFWPILAIANCLEL